MARFKGQAENSVDEKGRLAIPAKMRRVLTPEANETFTATLGFDQCIALYPNDRWEQMEDTFDHLNQFNSETRLFIRDTLRWAEDVSLDKQGRIVLPKDLMREVGLADTALVIGALDHIEVWDPVQYDAYLNERPAPKEEVAENVMGRLKRPDGRSGRRGMMTTTISFSTMTRRDDRSRPAPPAPYATGYHAPVLYKEVIDGLVTDPSGVYIDGTLGGGGHAAALLDALGESGRVVGIDQDPEALASAEARLEDDAEAGRFYTLRGNFGDLERLLAEAGIEEVDGILLDLGVSSHQIDEAERGFAYAASGPLDMRMDTDAPLTAADLVNRAEPEELIHILRAYGEEPRAPKIVRALVEARPVETTGALSDIVRGAVYHREELKTLARVFQALRIAVNDELTVLERALVAGLRVLRPGGRLAVIAYHSLEDRRAKQFLRYGNFEGEPVRDFYGNLLTPWDLITRKPITASEAEIEANPRARSARLRISEKRDPEESGLGSSFSYPQS